MQLVKGSKNWHNDHVLPNIQKEYNAYTSDLYSGFLSHYAQIKADADRLGVKIFNCTPNSAIKEFPNIPLSTFLANEDIITESEV